MLLAVLLCIAGDSHSRPTRAPRRAEIYAKVIDLAIIRRLRADADPNRPLRLRPPVEEDEALAHDDAIAFDRQAAVVEGDREVARAAQLDEIVSGPDERVAVEDLNSTCLCEHPDDEPGARALLVVEGGREGAHRDAQAAAVVARGEAQGDAEEGEGVHAAARRIYDRALVVH